MKTFYISLFIIILFGCISTAQENIDTSSIYPVKGESELYLGVGNYSSFLSENGFNSVDGTTDINNLGLSLGFDYYFSHSWSFKTRINYDPKGYAFRSSEVNLDYLTLPILANWHFGKNKRWYLHFGPYIGYLFGNNIDDLVDYRELDFGTDIGIGIKIPIGKFLFFIESDSQGSQLEGFEDNDNLTTELIQRNALTLGIIIGSQK